ncbi:MAG: hypothetical protein JWN31_377, partial [Frankiales bacterium]|nr:hypothetical protein [Frankiales bacterium]
PFFCMIRLRWGWWVGYLAFDAVMYVGLFRWYAAGVPAGGLTYQAVIIGVWGRAVMLALLFVVMLGSDTALRSADERTDGERVPEPALSP